MVNINFIVLNTSNIHIHMIMKIFISFFVIINVKK